MEILADGAIEDTEAANKFINKSQANVQRLVQLVKDIDIITNLEINKEPLIKQDFIIQDTIKDVVNNLSIKLEKKNIQFHFKKGSEALIHVFADKIKFIKSFLILLLTQLSMANKMER